MIWVVLIVAAIAILLLVFGAAYGISGSPKHKGEDGEQRVAKKLSNINIKDGEEGYVINDLLFKTSDGNSCQIDHIFIRKNGVWVIETKNYSGAIYGHEADAFWTQVLAYGNIKNSFRNPIKQNKTHIFRLSEYLGAKNIFKNLVVFSDKADLSHVQASWVVNEFYLEEVILSDNETILTNGQIISIYYALKKLGDERKIDIKEHIENIRKKQEDVENGVCPRCGGRLVLRNGKDGDFFGCENYPKCKFKKRM